MYEKIVNCILFSLIIAMVGFLILGMIIGREDCKQKGGVNVGYYGMDCYNNITHEYIN